MKDKKIFTRTKYARWAVMRTLIEIGDVDNEVYAAHLRCGTLNRNDAFAANKWSWFANDAIPECYGCGTRVPEYIQALVRLYLGR